MNAAAILHEPAAWDGPRAPNGLSRPRILFFIPTLLVGGAERHTVDLCQRLRQQGYRARILVHGPRTSPIMTAAPAGADAIILHLRGMSDPKGWLTVWRLLRRLKPDIIVAVNQSPLIIAVVERLLGATRAKIACIFHTTEMQDYEKYQAHLFRRVARFTDLMIYVGENQRRVWEARAVRPRRTSLIRNGIDMARFAGRGDQREAMRARLGVDPSTLLLGIVASFRIEKNHGELVAALAQARQAGVDAKALCVGDGETRGAVEDLAQRLGVHDRLIFAGEQPDVVPYLVACDAGILCSTAETFPLSAIEFLAAGVPMISARVGGAPEIVSHGVNGLLYPSGDVAAFAAAIVALADRATRAPLAAEAHPSVASFSADQMAERYAEAFDSLVRP